MTNPLSGHAAPRRLADLVDILANVYLDLVQQLAQAEDCPAPLGSMNAAASVIEQQAAGRPVVNDGLLLAV